MLLFIYYYILIYYITYIYNTLYIIYDHCTHLFLFYYTTYYNLKPTVK